jgi:hypothetical protein
LKQFGQLSFSGAALQQQANMVIRFIRFFIPEGGRKQTSPSLNQPFR